MNKRLKTFTIHFLLIFGGIAMLFPFLMMILGSFKTYQEIINPGVIFPSSLSLVNYKEALQAAPFDRYFLNTLIVAASSTTLVVITTIFAAFAFSKLEFYGKNLLFSIMIATLMVPGEMLIMTNFVTISRLGLIDNLLAMVIPYGASVFYIFMLRQFFMQIPQQIYYAAKIDGCSDWKYLWRVMVPNSKNAIATIALFNWIASWNAYIWPLIVTNDKNKRVLSIGLKYFSGEGGTDFQLLMAAGTIVVLPLIVIFLIARDRIIEGISKGGLKG